MIGIRRVCYMIVIYPLCDHMFQMQIFMYIFAPGLLGISFTCVVIFALLALSVTGCFFGYKTVINKKGLHVVCVTSEL